MEEESTSRRVDRIEEMTIPSDLEDKLAYVVAEPWCLSLAFTDSRTELYEEESIHSSNNGNEFVSWRNG